MSDSDANSKEDGMPTKETIELDVRGDKRALRVKLNDLGGDSLVFSLGTENVDELIAALGAVRPHLLGPITPELSGEFPITAINPRWYIYPDKEGKIATFWVRHPGFGWSIYGFTHFEANNIAKWIRKVLPKIHTRDAQSPAATSFGGDAFLVSTEGLGYYYFGKGDGFIGPDPFSQVEFDSDRASGIVAGAIVEARLEQVIRAFLPQKSQRALKISKDVFRPSGPLGAFGSKINLAYLMGLISESGISDLINLKDIRNKFAHNFEIDSFDAPEIKERCQNFVLVNRHVGPTYDRDISIIQAMSLPVPYFGMNDYSSKLLDARFRFVLTSQIFSYVFGMAADDPGRKLPLI